jgi:hypothetical protein
MAMSSSLERESSPLIQARKLVRGKALSHQDLQLLKDILQFTEGELGPLLDSGAGQTSPVSDSPQLARLQRSLGLFLVFLNGFTGPKPGKERVAMGQVLSHSLNELKAIAQEANVEVLQTHEEPAWVVYLLDFIASLRTMATSFGPEDSFQLLDDWAAFVQERRDSFKEMLSVLSEGPGGEDRVTRLNSHMKALNRALQDAEGRPIEAIHRLVDLLETFVPAETLSRVEPLLLVQHVLDTLRLVLMWPLDQGINWGALAQIRGSLTWLWNHLGWSLPRFDDRRLESMLTQDVRTTLKGVRGSQPKAFRLLAHSLASHLTILGLVDPIPAAGNMSEQERYAAVPTYFVVERELGRLAEQLGQAQALAGLPEGAEDTLLLAAFLRQAVLTLCQDQNTTYELLHEALTQADADHLALTLDHLKSGLINHQRQLMADLVKLFSPEIRQSMFPNSPTLKDEGDQLRQRLYRLWEQLARLLPRLRGQVREKDYLRLSLTLFQAHNHVTAFRRSPEFFLIRARDRSEMDRLTSAFGRILDAQSDLEFALVSGNELVEELFAYLEDFLARINARSPLISHDLMVAKEAFRLCQQLQESQGAAPGRIRLAKILIQSTKKLGVRDPQTLSLLRRWVRSERGRQETPDPIDALSSHLERLVTRLEAALG